MDGKEDGVQLKDLKPDTQYIVRVKAKGYDGISMSSKLHFTTNKFGEYYFGVYSRVEKIF